MTLAKIQLQNANNDPERMEEGVETLGNSLNELRSLSKSINPATLSSLSLVEATRLEIGRFNRLNYLEASMHVEGDEFPLDNKVEIIIFRMLQEFFTNTVKHSKATHLEVNLNYNEDTLRIEARDNGVGFDTFQKFPDRGIGLGNIKNRAQLIGATAQINSTIGEGTQLLVTYKLKTP
jgi:signal transduction histidine kinase